MGFVISFLIGWVGFIFFGGVMVFVGDVFFIGGGDGGGVGVGDFKSFVFFGVGKFWRVSFSWLVNLDFFFMVFFFGFFWLGEYIIFC